MDRGLWLTNWFGAYLRGIETVNLLKSNQIAYSLFGAYLRGIETYTQDLPTGVFVWGSESTYEGLKPASLMFGRLGSSGSEPTYEGLKRVTPHATPVSSPDGSEPTYEGLKPLR